MLDLLREGLQHDRMAKSLIVLSYEGKTKVLGTLGNDAQGHYLSRLTIDLRYRIKLRPIFGQTLETYGFETSLIFELSPIDRWTNREDERLTRVILKALRWYKQVDIARSYLDKVVMKMKKWAYNKRLHTKYKVEDMVLVKLFPQQFKSLRPMHKGLGKRSSHHETKCASTMEYPPETEANWELAHALLAVLSEKHNEDVCSLGGGECHKMLQMSLPMCLYKA
ncbi:hypothetical protein CK203_100647 [Vitis vinifera]|uniref:Uncharacterized protein n=1 Tax=Vitis vinifera TaxID=29760 RepID=A0A438CHP5_VITVI|nr:hypothetical protein CK203_100647 [Vitis vinifera]